MTESWKLLFLKFSGNSTQTIHLGFSESRHGREKNADGNTNTDQPAQTTLSRRDLGRDWWGTHREVMPPH